MISNYFTFRSLAWALDASIRQRLILEVFSQERDAAAIQFRDIPQHLILVCHRTRPTAYLHPTYTRAKANTARLCRTAWGTTIRSVRIHPSDRIISLILDNEMTLHAQLYGPRANLLLVDREGTVVDAFKDSARLTGSSYTIPKAQALYNPSELRLALRESPGLPLGSFLKRALPVFGPVLIQEILFRSGLPATQHPGRLTDPEVRRVDQAIVSLLGELDHPSPRFYYLGTPAKPRPVTPVFSLIRLQHVRDVQEETYDDLNRALREYHISQEIAGSLVQQKGTLSDPLERLIGRLQKAVQAIEHDLNTASRPAQWERYGQMLMANHEILAKGMRSVTLQDSSGEATIPLNPAQNPIENAQRYFQKAKDARVAQEKARQRLESEHRMLVQAQQIHSGLAQIQTPRELKRFMTENAEVLERLGVGPKSAARAQLPFRSFTVEGGFEVLAGKSNTSNDLLTMKHAKPRDLWFHARGSSGSHVVLKIESGRGEPTRRAKEQAAAIAAYYSKMRSAKHVPVAVTERKYVRKPKGAPPGTVVIEREQVIFAVPALPQQDGE